MTYFKILKDNEVVDVGCVFLKWSPRRKRMFVCDVNSAEFVQSITEEHVYTAYWLNPAPAEAGEYEEADVIVIEQQEFEDLRTLLAEGETISNEITEPVETPTRPVPPPEDKQEKPMSLAEMREIIAKQQEQIERLTQQIMK